MLRAPTVIDMPYLGGTGERDCLLMLDLIRRDLDDGRKMRPTMLEYCCLGTTYDTVPFLFWSMT